jgi:hypothetical protein
MAVDHCENICVASLLRSPLLRRPPRLICPLALDGDNFADERNAQRTAGLLELRYCRRRRNRFETGIPPEIPGFSKLAAVLADYEMALERFEAVSRFRLELAARSPATRARPL